MNQYTNDGHLKHIEAIAQEDAAGLLKAHESYGPSWKKRGGIGAYLVMIRKFDRMELAAERSGWDILEAVKNDPRSEGVIDDIRDARRYLMLIESWLREIGVVGAGDHRDNVPIDPGVSSLEKAHPYKDSGNGHPTQCHCTKCYKPDLPREEVFPGAMNRSFIPHTGKAACVLHKKGQPVDKNSAEYPDLEIARRRQHLRGCHNPDCKDPAHIKSHTGKAAQVLRDIDHPAGCDCAGCIHTRMAELERRKQGGRIDPSQVVLASEGPHLSRCYCEACVKYRSVEAKKHESWCECPECFGGCHPQCGCDKCVAEHYTKSKSFGGSPNE